MLARHLFRPHFFEIQALIALYFSVIAAGKAYARSGACIILLVFESGCETSLESEDGRKCSTEPQDTCESCALR